jgi:peptidylprolyl isomerase
MASGFPLWPSRRVSRWRLSRILGGVLQAVLVAVLTLLPVGVPAAWAYLPKGNAVTDPEALLRNALPIQQGNLQDLQHRLEDTSDDLRSKRWNALAASVRRTQSLLSGDRDTILRAFSAEQRDVAEAKLTSLGEHLRELAAAADAQNREGFLAARRASLSDIGAAEALLVGPFPFPIPSTYDNLPRLLGRATVELRTNKGTLVAVADGYNAPLTAGAFVDLVRRGFYDGLPFNRAEDFYVLQTGDPPGPAEGFLDPATKTERRVPLEIRIPGEPVPFYNQTFEDLGLFKAEPVLPFNAKGTLGWAHSDNALDDGSSQFFLFLSEPELTPAGLNLIDGRYAAFGYVVDGLEVLDELSADDKIISAKVIEGADNLQPHG